MKYFLAVDIGASSGRHMLAHMEEDRMVLEEVHRFYNGMTEKNGHKIWDAVAYRDARTTGMDEEVYRVIPDYFHYLLTGKPVQEYTNATTTQLVDPVTKDWNWELIRRLDYPEHIFQRIELPGHEIGTLRKVIREEVGFDCKVILPATHDTGAAVMAVPTVSEHPLYISSGTWSLMGTELTEADCSRNSCQKLLSKSWRSQKRMSFWITRLVCKLWIRVDFQLIKKKWHDIINHTMSVCDKGWRTVWN